MLQQFNRKEGVWFSVHESHAQYIGLQCMDWCYTEHISNGGQMDNFEGFLKISEDFGSTWLLRDSRLVRFEGAD